MYDAPFDAKLKMRVRTKTFKCVLEIVSFGAKMEEILTILCIIKMCVTTEMMCVI